MFNISRANSLVPDTRTFEVVVSWVDSCLCVGIVDFFSFTSDVRVDFFGDSSVSVVTVSSNVVLFSSATGFDRVGTWRRPPCRRVLTTRARTAAARWPRARGTFFRATPRPLLGADSSVSSASAVDEGSSSSSGTSLTRKLHESNCQHYSQVHYC